MRGSIPTSLFFEVIHLYKKAIAAILIIILIWNVAYSVDKKTKRYETEFLQLFDTITKIIAYAPSKAEFTKTSELIHDNLKEYHQLYDIYNDYDGINNIKTINDNAGISPVKVDRKIIDLLLYAKDAYGLTNGKINVAFGAVLKIWHDYRTEGVDDPEHAKLPPMDLLTEATKHTDINQVIINESDSTVFLKDPKMSLDVGAIAKGYATEQVSQFAMQHEFTSGIISVGGNVRTIGAKGKNNEPWNIGIENPDKESEQTNLMTVYVNDLSVVTSGDYERYYTVDGKRYHHIIDPVTLFPAQYFKSVTIICKDSGLADALSTAVFNMPYEQGLALIESMPDVDALWVFHNGDIKYSSDFKKYLKS